VNHKRLPLLGGHPDRDHARPGRQPFRGIGRGFREWLHDRREHGGLRVAAQDHHRHGLVECGSDAPAHDQFRPRSRATGHPQPARTVPPRGLDGSVRGSPPHLVNMLVAGLLRQHSLVIRKLHTGRLESSGDVQRVVILVLLRGLHLIEIHKPIAHQNRRAAQSDSLVGRRTPGLRGLHHAVALELLQNPARLLRRRVTGPAGSAGAGGVLADFVHHHRVVADGLRGPGPFLAGRIPARAEVRYPLLPVGVQDDAQAVRMPVPAAMGAEVEGAAGRIDGRQTVLPEALAQHRKPRGWEQAAPRAQLPVVREALPQQIEGRG